MENAVLVNSYPILKNSCVGFSDKFAMPYTWLFLIFLSSHPVHARIEILNDIIEFFGITVIGITLLTHVSARRVV